MTSPVRGKCTPCSLVSYMPSPVALATLKTASTNWTEEFLRVSLRSSENFPECPRIVSRYVLFPHSDGAGKTLGYVCSSSIGGSDGRNGFKFGSGIRYHFPLTTPVILA
jgi:hypothetical protein